LAVIIVNHKIANQYILSDGKTQALFGIIEILDFSYKYYLLIPCLISFLCGLLAIRKKEMKFTIQIALSLSILSIISVFMEIWKLMV